MTAHVAESQDRQSQYEGSSSMSELLRRHGEEVIWSGRPAGGIRFGKDDAAVTAFFVLWTLFSSLAFVNFAFEQREFVGSLITAGFVGIGIYSLIFRHPIDARNRESTQYALTDSRAIIASEFPRSRLRSISLFTIEVVRIDVHHDGAGSTIAISSDEDWPYKDEDGDPVRGPLFRYIDEPRKVERLLYEAQRRDADEHRV